MTINEAPSPNFDERGGKPIDILLLHYTGMKTAAEAIARLRDPAAKVSAHYVVDEDGSVLKLVDENMRAWHAGVSYWAGERDINARSIGVEIVNPGHEFGYRAFPAAQIASVIALCKDVLARRAIPAHRVLGHSDVAPLRKQDPGEKFPWARLAAEGVGLTPETGRGAVLARAGDSGAVVGMARSQLARIGYEVTAGPILDDDIQATLIAFQRHFRPQHTDGILDAATLNAVLRIARAVPA